MDRLCVFRLVWFSLVCDSPHPPILWLFVALWLFHNFFMSRLWTCMSHSLTHSLVDLESNLDLLKSGLSNSLVIQNQKLLAIYLAPPPFAKSIPQWFQQGHVRESFFFSFLCFRNEPSPPTPYPYPLPPNLFFFSFVCRTRQLLGEYHRRKQGRKSEYAFSLYPHSVKPSVKVLHTNVTCNLHLAYF